MVRGCSVFYNIMILVLTCELVEDLWSEDVVVFSIIS